MTAVEGEEDRSSRSEFESKKSGVETRYEVRRKPPLITQVMALPRNTGFFLSQ